MPNGTYQAEVTSSSEDIKPVALSEGVCKLVGQQKIYQTDF